MSSMLSSDDPNPDDYMYPIDDFPLSEFACTVREYQVL
jgi:hypothetical protein